MGPSRERSRSVPMAWSGRTWRSHSLPSIIVADTPVVTVGVITFNEDGTCVSAATTKAGDVSVIPPHPSSACTFSVNPDGTGKISVTKTGSPFSPVELAFAIVNADELLLITTDELVLSGVAKRQ